MPSPSGFEWKATQWMAWRLFFDHFFGLRILAGLQVQPLVRWLWDLTPLQRGKIPIYAIWWLKCQCAFAQWVPIGMRVQSFSGIPSMNMSDLQSCGKWPSSTFSFLGFGSILRSSPKTYVPPADADDDADAPLVIAVDCGMKLAASEWTDTDRCSARGWKLYASVNSGS